MVSGEVKAPRAESIPGAVTIEARHRLPHDVVSELLAVLAGEPPVVLCDLTGIAPAASMLVADLAPVADYLDHWPGCVVMLHSPDEPLRTDLTGAHLGDRILVSGSWVDGLVEAVSRKPTVRSAQLLLAPTPGAAREARAFVARVLQQWGLASLIDPAVLVTSELTTNSIGHARTVLALSISTTATRVRIAVGDRGRGLDMRDPEVVDDMALGGRGLLLVHASARAWGVLPGRHAGKTVWVVLDTDQPLP